MPEIKEVLQDYKDLEEKLLKIKDDFQKSRNTSLGEFARMKHFADASHDFLDVISVCEHAPNEVRSKFRDVINWLSASEYHDLCDIGVKRVNRVSLTLSLMSDMRVFQPPREKRR